MSVEVEFVKGPAKGRKKTVSSKAAKALDKLGIAHAVKPEPAVAPRPNQAPAPADSPEVPDVVEKGDTPDEKASAPAKRTYTRRDTSTSTGRAYNRRDMKAED
jgi:hypothetical protein